MTPFWSLLYLKHRRCTELLFNAVVVVLLACSVTPVLAAGQKGVPILNYTLTEVDRDGQLMPGEEWATFEPRVCWKTGSFVAPATRFLSDLLPMNVRTDFFYKTNVSMAISSLGFLTPANVPMCYSMCADTSPSTMYGFYQFTNDATQLESLGGDWPVVALYLSLIAPSSAPGLLCRSPVQKTVSVDGETVEWETVEFHDYTNSRTQEGTLNAQVSVYSNGTIIMRYTDVPAPFLAATTGLKPSVGLVLSKRQRIVAQAPSFKGTRTVGKRFDPIRDPCAVHAARAACVADTQCGWCRATSLCISASVGDDQCPQSYLDTADSAETPTPGTASSLYDVRVTQDSCYHKRSSTRYVKARVTNVAADWVFPFFGQADVDASSATLLLQNFGAYHDGPVGALNSCNPLWGVCVNGNYTNVIAPFLTALTTSDEYGTTNPLTRSIAVDTVAHSVRVVSPKAFLYARYAGTAFAVHDLWYEMYFDSSGTVEFLFGCNPVLDTHEASNPSRSESSAVDGSSEELSSSGDDGGAGPEEQLYAMDVVYDYYTHPKAFVGLIRHTVQDRASVLIPPQLIRTGTRVRFTLKTKCLDCGVHGVCNEATGVCVCDKEFAGARCTDCAAGHYGAECAACPTCANGGLCDDGVRGSGYCRCVAHYGGPQCETECSSTPPCDAGACLAGGHGYCGCDGCVCADGFTGSECRTPPRDPCEQYSLDGCEQCARMKPDCQYCFDRVCFSPAAANAGVGYACSRTIPPNFKQICTNLAQIRVIGTDRGYYTLGALSIFLVLLYVVVGIISHHLLRSYRDSHYDIHVMVAAGGLVDFRPPRREREIVEAQLVSAARAKTQPHLLGFVLKQISLKKLYRRQRHLDRDGTDPRHE